MNQNNNSVFIVIAIAMLTWFLAGCTTTGSNAGSSNTGSSTGELQLKPEEVVARFNNSDNSFTALSEEGKYRVSLKSNLFPLQTGKIQVSIHLRYEFGIWSI